MARKRKYTLRSFECPVCKNKIQAAKRSGKMTPTGHVKTMWCPFCTEVRDFIQLPFS